MKTSLSWVLPGVIFTILMFISEIIVTTGLSDFTATQIPNIEGRIYPPELSGKLYPNGVPIYSESRLTDLIQEHKVDLVTFSYSDIPHTQVMHKASMVMAGGADFMLIGATPIDLSKLLSINKPTVRVRYEYKDHDNPLLENVLIEGLQKVNAAYQ